MLHLVVGTEGSLNFDAGHDVFEAGMEELGSFRQTGFDALGGASGSSRHAFAEEIELGPEVAHFAFSLLPVYTASLPR
jgi:hypothetical protein